MSSSSSEEDPFAFSDEEKEHVEEKQAAEATHIGDDEEAPTARREYAEDIDRFLFSRPGEEPNGDVVLTLPNGDRYYMLVDEARNLENATPGIELTDRYTYDNVEALMKEIEAEGEANVSMDTETDTQMLNSQYLLDNLNDDEDEEMETDTGKRKLPKLWVDKYAPRRFIELVSNERTNRLVLKWLKSWDPFVYKSKPKSVPKTGEKGGNQVKDDVRPEQKVILLSGPPGSGKSTLAHVVALHCGYAPMEVNASSARTEKVLRNLIYNAMETQSAFGDARPKCIILDEIEGVSNQGEDKGVSKLLMELIKAPLRKGKKRNREALSRPIICICNDAYSPVLRQLRMEAFHVPFKPAEEGRLTQRLSAICKLEQVAVRSHGLRFLCTRMENDIRSCLHALQFLKSKGGKITDALIEDYCSSRKDKKAHIFDTLKVVFRTYSKKKKLIPNEEVDPLRALEKHSADFEIVFAALHENILQVKFADSLLTKTFSCLDAISNYDRYFMRVRQRQQYSLMPYLPFVGVEITGTCNFEPGARPTFPTKYFEKAKAQRNNVQRVADIARLVNNGALGDMPGVLLSRKSISLDISYYVEKFSPVDSPGMTKLVNLANLLDNLASKEEEDFEKRTLTKSAGSSKTEVKDEVKKDFFGRVHKRPREVESAGSRKIRRKEVHINFHFNEGLTNAIRRSVRISDFINA